MCVCMHELVLVGGISCSWVLWPRSESRGLFFRKVTMLSNKKMWVCMRECIGIGGSDLLLPIA